MFYGGFEDTAKTSERKSKMKVQDRPSEMQEMRNSKTKEDMNAYGTLMTWTCPRTICRTYLQGCSRTTEDYGTFPTFNGDKRKFEDVWARFTSLVDESTEQVHLKMARLRKCLTGKALEAIRGLGVTANEYQKAKQILKTKYEGTRRLLRAYLDQLEQALLIRRNDIHALEKFADLVRICGKVTGRTKRSLKRFWEIEKSGAHWDDRLVLTKQKSKVKDSLKYKNGRCLVAVSWKENKPDLPDAKPMVLSRIRNTKRNLKKKSHVAEEYQATIQANVDKGYLRKVPSNEQLPAYVWCLPHFSVVRKDKSTTKCESCLTVLVVAQESNRRRKELAKLTYTEDSIDSPGSDDEGVELYHQLKALSGVASMQATKWISNLPKVIGAIPSQEHATEIVINSGQDPITKTLGIPWNSTEDVFTFALCRFSSFPGISDNKGKRPA
ncbi:hypothetical protein AWC38_SpisGene24233 [Stylophora pistillata]|uniref:Uncharacterized protein n=1 Tax=Stylophora pistillata TaxID=50429 RepID=A0A2B4R416_STYPI|nr:hypothetical protein AWC38_SpisGene24233 [Stylophora pistillata]